MAAKKSNVVPATVLKQKREEAQSSGSKFKGKGTKRTQNRFIVVSGFPKTRKTTAVSTFPLGRTKWIASDSNCAATLEALGRMPHPDDFHEVTSLAEATQLTNEMLDAAEAGEPLGFEFLVLDSTTQFSDWHQQDIAKDTSQSYLGEQAGMGWQQFNADFGKLLDNLAALTRYITVVAIAHTKAGFEKKKAGNASLSLPPQMAEKLARLANWILFKTLEEKLETEGLVPDEYITMTEVRGEKHYFESILHTQPSGAIVATVNSFKLLAEEPGDLWAMMVKDGIVS